MDLGQRKEQFSHAVVRAIAASIGVSCYTLPVDDDSIDIGFAAKTTGRPRVEAQLKCSERDILRHDGIHFALTKKNYDDLRIKDLDVPRILIVVLVPEDIGQWVTLEADQVVLRRCAWWLSLAGMPDRPNAANVTVILPLHQRLDGVALSMLMARPAGGAS